MRGGLQHKRLVSKALVVVIGVCAMQCGGGEPPLHFLSGNPDGGVDISGYAIKGPISGGTVTAYQLLPDMTRGQLLTTGSTNSAGYFGLSLPPYSGDVLLVVNGGTYLEEALADGRSGAASTPVAINVDYVGLLIGYQTGQAVTADITPVSHLAFSLARYHVKTLGEPVAQAVANAFAHLGAHFGNIPEVATDLDWETVVPTSLGGGGGVQLTAPQRAAVVLAGFSQLAAAISTRAGVTPGGQVNALSLLSALAQDLEADGVFDGLGPGGQQLLVPANGTVQASGPSATALDGSTVRVALASAIAAFIASGSNSSSITIPDIGGVTSALSADSDRYLFTTAGTTFDVTPPKLTVVSAPPPYTSQSSVGFSVSADDGANSTGVKMVMARTGSGTTLTGANTSGNIWTFSNVPTGGGTAFFEVWAVDNANNSGEQLPVGDYHLQLPCLEDSAPPTILQDFSVPSYLDERSMQLVSNATPPQFVWPGKLPAAVGPGVDGAIWKSSVRLSWGTAQPTGATLESANSNNVPFVQIGIPFNAATDAPIASVTYSIALQTGPTSSGTLIPAGRQSTGVVYFDLPFTEETIPDLATSSISPIAFSVLITAADAAGNVTTNLLASSTANAFSLHVIGPPLYVQQDTAYATAGDPKSIYPFAVANGSYPNKFAGDNGGEVARQARFIVYNPYSVNVPFSTAFPTYETTGTEEWDDLVWTAGSVTWDVANTCAQGPPCSYFGAQPQPFVPALGSTSYSCEATSNPQSQANPPGTAFSSTTASISAWVPGAEDVRPSGYADRVSVPAAQGATPGSVVVYVGRPWSDFGLPADTFTTEMNPDGVLRLYRFLQDLWQSGAHLGGTTCNCVAHPPGPPVCQHSVPYQYTQRRWTNVLSAASETFTGTWNFETYAGLTPTSDLGDGAASSIQVSGNATY